MRRPDITAEQLRAALHYDPATGVFTRLVGSPRTPVGSVAGSLNELGYIRIHVGGGLRYAQRLAWLYVTGAWPKHEIDHINGVRANNRWANLRDVPRSLNTQNRAGARSDSSTGVLGITPHGNGFRARIGFGGGKRLLGTFPTEALAHAAYLKAKRELHPASARL